MNEISCDMCIDLMPLVQDGVASEDSRNAVLQHLQECSRCSEMYEGEVLITHDAKEILLKVKRRVQFFFLMVMMFGVFYGVTLTSSGEMFYNTMIMPVIGAIGYYLFRWKGLYLIPCLLLISHLVTNALGLAGARIQLDRLLAMTLIYCLVALVGFIVAVLLHFVFKKEDET